MAVELATAYISILPDTHRLAPGVKAALRDLNQDMTRIQRGGLGVSGSFDKIAVAADKAAKSTAAQSGELDKVRTRQEAVTSATVRQQNATDALASAERKLAQVRADSESKLVRLRAQAGADASRQQALADEQVRSENRIADAAARVERAKRAVAEASTAQARAERQLNSQVERSRTRVTRTSTVERGGTDNNLLRNLPSELNKVGKFTGIASAITAGIAGIGGAAGAAAGAVGGLGLGLAALGGPALAGIGAVALGLQGVGDAFKAVLTSMDSAGSDAETKSKAVASANQQLTSANQGLVSAEKNVARAKKDSEEAEKDLTRARKAAKQQIDDLNFALSGTALSERDAALSVQEARDALAQLDPSATATERARAELNVEEALRRQQEVLRSNQQLQEKANAANAAGVEGSDEVVSAKDRLADANDRVVDAEQGVVTAQGQVALAQQNLNDAMNSTSASADKAAQAMAKLSPNAQAFVKAMIGIKPLFDDLKNTVQDNLFAGLDDTFTNLAQNSLPVMKDSLGGIASALNDGVTAWANWFGQADHLEQMRVSLAGVGDAIRAMIPGLETMSQGFLDAMAASGPQMQAIGAAFGQIAASIGNVFTQMANTGQLQSILNSFADALTHFGPALGNLISALATMADKVMPTLGPLFDSLGAALGQMAPALGDLGATFVQALTPILPVLGELISSLAEGLRPVLPVLSQLFIAIGRAIEPLIGPLSQILQVLGEAFTQAIVALTPALGPVAQAFADITNAVAPLIPLFAKDLAVVLQALAPAFSQIATALAPVIAQFTEAMMPVLEQMAPVLAEVASIIGQALADALTAIAPYIPDIAKSWGDFLVALAPLLPALAKLAADILPPLMSLFVEFAPLISKIIDLMTWLAQNVIIPIVVPILGALGDAFHQLGDDISGVIDWAKKRFDDFKTALGKLRDFFGTIVSGIGQAWDGLKAIAAAPINFFIETVWNNGIGGLWDKAKGVFHLPDFPRASPVKFASGGYVRGPGGPKDDRIPAMLSDGEYVLTAEAVRQIGVANLDRFNRNPVKQGGTPLGEGMLVGIDGVVRQGMEAGGSAAVALENVKQFMQREDGKPYQYAGVGNPSWDCSGLWSGIVHVLNGEDPRSGRLFTTESNFDFMGWKRGLGGAVTIGIMRGGGGENSHMAGTVAGTNAESSGDHGVRWGGPARGADNAMFSLQYFLPEVGGEFRTGGNAVGTSGGSVLGRIANFFRDKAADLFEKPLRMLGNTIPDFGGSLIGKLPKAFFNAAVDVLVDFVRGKGEEQDKQSGGSDVAAAVPGTGPVVDQVKDAFAPYGWSDGAQWAAADWIVQHESGWNPTARNPQSGAFGLFQFLGSTKDQYLPDENPNPKVQGAAGARYIHDRYGDPLSAKAFWEQHHWYDSGGVFPNNTVGINTSGKPEAVLTNDQWKLLQKFVEQLQQGHIVEAIEALRAPAPIEASPSTSASTATSAEYSPMDSVNEFGRKMGDIAPKAALEIFGLEGTLADPGHRYYKAAQDIAQTAIAYRAQHSQPAPAAPADPGAGLNIGQVSGYDPVAIAREVMNLFRRQQMRHAGRTYFPS